MLKGARVSLFPAARFPKRSASREGVAEPFSIRAQPSLLPEEWWQEQQDPRHLHTSGNWQMHIFDTQQHSLNHIRTTRSVKSVPHIKASPRRRLSDSQSSYSYVWIKTPGEKWLFHFLMSRFLGFLSNILNLYHPHLDTIHLFNCESGGIKEKHYCRQHQWWLKENHEAALPGEPYLPSALITVVIC